VESLRALPAPPAEAAQPPAAPPAALNKRNDGIQPIIPPLSLISPWVYTLENPLIFNPYWSPFIPATCPQNLTLKSLGD